MDNYSVKINKTFTEIIANDGYVLTNWDKKDIINFTYSKALTCSNSFDYSKEYYTITEAECKELENELIKIIEEKNN